MHESLLLPDGGHVGAAEGLLSRKVTIFAVEHSQTADSVGAMQSRLSMSTLSFAKCLPTFGCHLDDQ